LIARWLLAAFLACASAFAWAHGTKASGRLPVIGAAPDFALTNQDGERVSLADSSGTVRAVTFIYATCKDTCPLLTAKMALMQRKLGADFGKRVRFVSITVEPEVDTPAVLKAYAGNSMPTRRAGASSPGRARRSRTSSASTGRSPSA
jgi:protein SCO1/2